MPAADHGEAVGGGEEARAGKRRHRLLAGVDEVGVDLVLHRERPDAEKAVLGLQHHVDAFGNVVGDERRQSDAEVDVETVAQLLGGAGSHLFTGPGHVRCLLYTSRCV